MTLKKVMVFGTFDMVHPGHLNLFEQAKAEGGEDAKLYVVVARDFNVRKAKGMFPINNENIRLANVKKQAIVDEAILGDSSDYYKVIEKFRPDIICLGYDQTVPPDFGLQLKKRKVIAEIKRMKAYNADKYKSSILKL